VERCVALRSVAERCGALRSVAERCGALRSVAERCGALRSVAERCGALRSVAERKPVSVLPALETLIDLHVCTYIECCRGQEGPVYKKWLQRSSKGCLLILPGPGSLMWVERLHFYF
jgi:hypothetical protein